MQALNFLGVDPSPNWIDYYLSIEKLSSLLVTSENELVESKILDKALIRVTAEFCEQAQSLESRLNAFHGSDEERLFVERRTGKLKAMGLYVCAHWNWNLFKICDSLGVVNSRYLLEKLCGMVMPNFTSLIDMFNIDYGTITDGLYRFLIVLSARWVLHSVVYERFVDTATKRAVCLSLSNNNRPNLLDAYQACLAEVETMAVAAGKFLLQFCQDNSAILLLPGISCFKFNTADEDVVSFEPAACDQISNDIQRLMALFDLGEHYFFEQKFDEAKECFSLILPHLSTIEGLTDAHSYASSQRLHGYAIALGLPRSEDVELPTEHVLNEPPSEQMAVFLLEDIPSKTVSLSRRLLLERKASETLLPVYAEVYSANIIRNFGEGFPVTQSLLHFLSRSENLPIFCLTLIKAKKLKLLENGLNVRLFLEFLCQRIPCFFESLASCQLLSLLSDEERPRPRDRERIDSEMVVVLPSASQSCRKALFKVGSNPWDMLGCTSPSEFKAIILQADCAKRFHRSGAFFSEALMGFREQLRGSEAVVVRLCLYLLDGLLNVNHYRTCKNWLEACKCALSPTTSNYLTGEYGNELLRRELIIWHRFLDAHAKADFKKWTQSIATNVRTYVADQCRLPVESSQTSYLNCLVTCFLVNTSDWEYILCQDRNGLRGKYVDFAKVLAALCFEVSKDGPNTRTYAREFFDIVTSAFASSGQTKRTASGAPVSTTSCISDGPFLNRIQFISMLKLIREPLSISILLSFFCKIYNNSQHGLVELVAEHNGLWPATTQSAISFDASFLTEALEVVLSNAIFIQPSNPFWLRTYGDFRLTAEKYNSAMKYYLEALMAKSLCFTEELSPEFFDKRMLNSMIKCSNKLRYHTIETLLCQCSSPPNYSLACKACTESCCWDGSDHFYELTWDTTVLECVIATMTDKQLYPKRNVLLSQLACPELNSFNMASVAESVIRRRKAMFFRALFAFFL